MKLCGPTQSVFLDRSPCGPQLEETARFDCEAEGNRPSGEVASFYSVGSNRPRAESRALAQCRRAGYPRCFIVTCNDAGGGFNP